MCLQYEVEDDECKGDRTVIQNEFNHIVIPNFIHKFILISRKNRLKMSVYEHHSTIFANNYINPNFWADGDFSQCIRGK